MGERHQPPARDIFPRDMVDVIEMECPKPGKEPGQLGLGRPIALGNGRIQTEAEVEKPGKIRNVHPGVLEMLGTDS